MFEEQTDLVCKLLEDIPLGELYSDKFNFKKEYGTWINMYVAKYY